MAESEVGRGSSDGAQTDARDGGLSRAPGEVDAQGGEAPGSPPPVGTGRPPEGPGDGFRHRHLNVGEVALHVVEAGPERDAPLVVLLHGFPEFWWSWRRQLRALSEAGFHVVAPDLRGFHLSDKPRAVRAYRLDALADDVAGLIRACGASKASVVGHDWGAAIAWEFAQRRPQMLELLGIINVPHPAWWRRALRSPKQLRKSWYMLFFQLPWLSERWLRRDDYRNLRRFCFERDGVDAWVVDQYVEAAAPGADRRDDARDLGRPGSLHREGAGDAGPRPGAERPGRVHRRRVALGTERRAGTGE
jgi:pimeloyl-ACP methyl ester carboxylesterase